MFLKVSYHIYTDGACSNPTGEGGWAAIVVVNKWGPKDSEVVELSGYELGTTNNRMELTAAIKALQYLSNPTSIKLFTDSKYVKDGISKWVPTWKRHDWKTRTGDPVKNQDLWQLLAQEDSRHSVDWTWVRGHSGHPLNERCDQLAVQAKKRQG